MSADGMGKWVFLILLGVAIVAAVRVSIRVPRADVVDSGPALAAVGAVDADENPLESAMHKEPDPRAVQMPASFSLFGRHDEVLQRDRCSDDARNKMASFIGEAEASDGDVLVAESWWGTLTTSSRVGIASWLSQCNHDGRPVRIRGNESGVVLATYDSRDGYL